MMSTHPKDNERLSTNPYKSPVSVPSVFAKRFATLVICSGMAAASAFGGLWIYGRSIRSSDSIDTAVDGGPAKPEIIMMRSPVGGERTRRHTSELDASRSHLNDPDDPFSESNSVNPFDSADSSGGGNPFESPQASASTDPNVEADPFASADSSEAEQSTSAADANPFGS